MSDNLGIKGKSSLRFLKRKSSKLISEVVAADGLEGGADLLLPCRVLSIGPDRQRPSGSDLLCCLRLQGRDQSLSAAPPGSPTGVKTEAQTKCPSRQGNSPTFCPLHPTLG